MKTSSFKYPLSSLKIVRTRDTDNAQKQFLKTSHDIAYKNEQIEEKYLLLKDSIFTRKKLEDKFFAKTLQEKVRTSLDIKYYLTSIRREKLKENILQAEINERKRERKNLLIKNNDEKIILTEAKIAQKTIEKHEKQWSLNLFKQNLNKELDEIEDVVLANFCRNRK